MITDPFDDDTLGFAPVEDWDQTQEFPPTPGGLCPMAATPSDISIATTGQVREDNSPPAMKYPQRVC